jgi:hypothetical protein
MLTLQEITSEQIETLNAGATVLESRTVGTYRVEYRLNPLHGTLEDEKRYDVQVLTADGTVDHYEQFNRCANVARKLDGLVRQYRD